MDTIEKINTNCVILAKNIKTLLNQHQLNESELARVLNLPYNTVHRIVTGITTDPRISTLQQIANYFNVSLDLLLNETGINPQGMAYHSQHIPLLQWDTLETLTDLPLSGYPSHRYISVADIDNIERKENLFALESKKSMRNKYPLGTTFIISPDEKAIDGDLVLIRFNKDNAVSLRELAIDSPTSQLLPIVPGSVLLSFDNHQHTIMGIVILTLIQTR